MVILGLHDYMKTINKIINYVSTKNKTAEFICKVHPKTILNKEINNENPKIKIVKNLKSFTFRRIFISKFSTLSYDFILQKKNFLFYIKILWILSTQKF